MTRIAILGSRGFPSHYGGFETLVRHLAPYIASKGHDVTVYGRDKAAGAVIHHESGVTVRNVWGVDRKSTSTLTFGLSATVDLAQRGCDAALILNVANGLYLPILKRAGIATVVNVDGLEWHRRKWGVLAKTSFWWGAKRVAKYADEVIFDSRGVSEFWATELGRSGKFIPYGAPIPDAVGDQTLRDRGLPLGGYVLIVARVAPENNIELMLDAVERLEEMPPIIVVGSGNYRHGTTRRLERLSRIGTIHWLGHVDDDVLLTELWANAGVYWHGHSVGGTNPALLQALGAGAPTLALDTKFNREVIQNDDQIVQNNVTSIASKVREVLTAPDVADRWRAWGKVRISQAYMWDAVCADYVELLTDAARPNDHPGGWLLRERAPGISKLKRTARVPPAAGEV